MLSQNQSRQQSQSINDLNPDWSNPRKIWSTPLESLLPPPIGPFTLPTPSWEASLPFRVPMYSDLPQPTIEVVDNHDIAYSEDENKAIEPSDSLYSGDHAPIDEMTFSPLEINSPWSTHVEQDLSTSSPTTVESHRRSSTLYTESSVSTFDSQLRRTRTSQHHIDEQEEQEEQINSSEPYFKAFFVTDRFDDTTVHILRGQKWERLDRTTQKVKRRHQRTLEGSIDVKI